MIDWVGMNGGRFKVAAFHFVISVAIVVLVALAVLLVWYPHPYRELSDGFWLLGLLASVQVVLGPLLVFVVWTSKKPVAVFRRDVAVISILQIVGLLYGVSVIYDARPIYLVYEFDRFRVVHASDVPVELYSEAPPGIPASPFLGPDILGIREFESPAEKFNLTLAALAGLSVSAQPSMWQAYSASVPRVVKSCVKVDKFLDRYPTQLFKIHRIAEDYEIDSVRSLCTLPIVGRKGDWTVVLDGINGRHLAYLPFDSF